MSEPRTILVRRIYEPQRGEKELRVLVDRLWPRGVSREKAALDRWEKDLAPSSELREWFDHQPVRFDEFRQRYLDELAAREKLAEDVLSDSPDLTLVLLYAARDEVHNHAKVLSDFLSNLKTCG